MLVAVLVPLVGELLGWLPSTFTITSDGVLLHTPALRGSATSLIAIMLVYVSFTIVFAGTMGYVTGRSERVARRQLHLQAWQLRQLVSR